MSEDDGRSADYLPIDPDIETDRGASRSALPSIDPRVPLAVFAGGVFGGLARYGIGVAAPPRADGFPWDIFAINLAGAFALALLLVIVLEVLPPTRFVRPALGTGFLGAFTTFSSLATASDRLAAHHQLATAATYVLASLLGGLLATVLGLVSGRAVKSRSVRKSVTKSAIESAAGGR
jgi:CrcB protein